ncbi:MAG: PEPxxWA-CTERM sorting domain-containing protein [Caulobacteraceae bacterium]
MSRRLSGFLAFGSLAASTLAVSAAPLAANATELVVNGSFEADDFGTGGGGQRLGLIGNDVTGWFIPAGDGIYPWGLQNGNQYNAGPADTGNQWFILGEVGTGKDYTVQQTVNGLTSGQTYNLTFALASELGCCAVGEVSFLSGSSTAAQNFTAPSSGSYWTSWGHYTDTFVATASSVTFQVKDLAIEFPGGDDLGLDSFSILAGGGVPEPASWAMMLIGFAAIGAGLRQRGRALAA